MAKDNSKAVNIERDKNLSTAIAQIEKAYGKGSIMNMDPNSVIKVPAISTGSLALDIALGIGGVPRGRICEIYGPESSGKTTVCLHIIANAQKAGGIAAIIDAEHAIDPVYAEKIGVNVKDLIISQPDCGEDALNITDVLIRSNSVDVIVIDSVAALVPRAEIDGSMGDSHMGLQARLMSQALRKLTGAAAKSRTTVIFTNQIREKIGVMFGNPETTTGGNALKFYASIRMDIRRSTQIKDNAGEVIGNLTKVKVVKNKMAPPFRIATFDINYGEGISRAGSILDVGSDLDIVEKRGSWFSFEGKQLGQGKEAVKTLISNDLDLQARILKKIKDHLSKKDAPAEEAVADEKSSDKKDA